MWLQARTQCWVRSLTVRSDWICVFRTRKPEKPWEQFRNLVQRPTCLISFLARECICVKSWESGRSPERKLRRWQLRCPRRTKQRGFIPKAWRVCEHLTHYGREICCKTPSWSSLITHFLTLL